MLYKEQECLTDNLKGIAGLTKRDIQLFVDGGFNTVESIAYTPKKALELLKGVSEQKATKILVEGKLRLAYTVRQCSLISSSPEISIQACSYGFHYSDRNACTPQRAYLYHNWL